MEESQEPVKKRFNDEGPQGEPLHPKNHVTDFDPKAYLESFYCTAHEDSAMQLIIFFLPGLAVQLPPGRTLLDVGSGPTVHVAFAFRKQYSKIYLSDYAAQNRQFLRYWWDNEPNPSQPGGVTVFEWSRVAEWMAMLEAAPVGEGRRMEQETRERVKGILEVNVHEKDLILNSYPGDLADIPAKFDLVTCIFCLEYASMTRTEFRSALTNVVRRIRPGGYLIIGGCFDEDSYFFNGKRFSCYNLSRTELLDSLKHVGMCHQQNINKSAYPLDFKLIENNSTFIVASKKPAD